jgi:osmoprotectant transport system substrate-binding protein
MRRGGVAAAVPVLGLVLAAALAAGCSPDPAPPPQDPRRPSVVVASFDFPESELLAELYGQALRGRGYPVEVVARLGAREVVEPALEQGKVDLLPEYLGTALNFLEGGAQTATADAAATHARLVEAFAARGVGVRAFAPAQDRNAFVVSGDLSRRHRLERIGDLLPLAGRLTFGGPPECPERVLCLKGLRDRYGLEFARFKAMPSRQVTAAALDTGEIHVGMIETTDASLTGQDLVQLKDDRGLQPAENVVPVVRREVLDAYGPALGRLLDAVSAQLTTAGLMELNRQVTVEGQPPGQVAAAWLRSHPLQR